MLASLNARAMQHFSTWRLKQQQIVQYVKHVVGDALARYLCCLIARHSRVGSEYRPYAPLAPPALMPLNERLRKLSQPLEARPGKNSEKHSQGIQVKQPEQIVHRAQGQRRSATRGFRFGAARRA